MKIHIYEILVFLTHNYPLNLKLQPCMYLQKFDFELVLVKQSATLQFTEILLRVNKIKP